VKATTSRKKGRLLQQHNYGTMWYIQCSNTEKKKKKCGQGIAAVFAKIILVAVQTIFP